MVDPVQFGQQPFDHRIGQDEGVAAGDQHVADPVVGPDIVERLGVGLPGVHLVPAADVGQTEAVGAEHGAHVGGLDRQHPGVELVDQPGRGVVGGYRRDLDPGVLDHLAGRHRLQHDRVVDRSRQDQAGVIGGQAHPVGLGHLGDRLQLGRRQVDQPGQDRDGIDGMADLAGKGVPSRLIHAQCGHDPGLIVEDPVPDLDAARGVDALGGQVGIDPAIGAGGNGPGPGQAAADRDHVLVDLLVLDGEILQVAAADGESGRRGCALPVEGEEAVEQVEDRGRQVRLPGPRVQCLDRAFLRCPRLPGGGEGLGQGGEEFRGVVVEGWVVRQSIVGVCIHCCHTS